MNSDYVVNGHGTFAGSAVVVGAVAPLGATIYYRGYRSSGLTPVVGDPVWIGGEFMRIVTFEAGKLTVARGCIDTIPRPIADGETIWFIRNALGTNNVVYAEGETVGIKTLPRTDGATQVAVAAAFPEGLQFVGRFARPYAPGNVKINGEPWFTTGEVVNSDNSIEITWVHRDRIVQADQLVGHTEASIGPEEGVTYRVRLYRADSPSTVVTEVAGITGTSFTYDAAAATEDFDMEYDDQVDCALTLETLRDDLTAIGVYVIFFSVTRDQPYGLGFRLGVSLGGLTP